MNSWIKNKMFTTNIQVRNCIRFFLSKKNVLRIINLN